MKINYRMELTKALLAQATETSKALFFNYITLLVSGYSTREIFNLWIQAFVMVLKLEKKVKDMEESDETTTTK